MVSADLAEQHRFSEAPISPLQCTQEQAGSIEEELDSLPTSLKRSQLAVDDDSFQDAVHVASTGWPEHRARSGSPNHQRRPSACEERAQFASILKKMTKTDARKILLVTGLKKLDHRGLASLHRYLAQFGVVEELLPVPFKGAAKKSPGLAFAVMRHWKALPSTLQEEHMVDGQRLGLSFAT